MVISHVTIIVDSALSAILGAIFGVSWPCNTRNKFHTSAHPLLFSLYTTVYGYYTNKDRKVDNDR